MPLVKFFPEIKMKHAPKYVILIYLSDMWAFWNVCMTEEEKNKEVDFLIKRGYTIKIYAET